MKPMLAATIKNIKTVKYPCYVSPKLDGIRGVVINGALKSRTLKPVPNLFTSDRFSKGAYNGLDGELILGDPTAPDVYRSTQKATSSIGGTPDVKFFVFDIWSAKGGYEERRPELIIRTQRHDPNIILLPQHLIRNEDELLKYEQDTIDIGYEGVIGRSIDGGYKHGRSSVKQGWLWKLKRFLDSEAEILELLEEMENTNEKQTNELGRSKRSSHKAGKVGKGCTGALRVRDLTSGVEFKVGSGISEADAPRLSVGQVIKYKYFPVGIKDKPRHPVFLGLRDKWDIS
jgi:DNA ligase-1